MPEDKKITRMGDGHNHSALTIRLTHDGDVIVTISGLDKDGKPSEATIEFCAPFGGEYHLRTIKAFYLLSNAIEKDNKDKKSPKRYKGRQ